MMDKTLKLLGLGLCIAIAGGCGDDGTDGTGSDDSATTDGTGGTAETTDTPTTGTDPSATTTDTPSTTDEPSTGVDPDSSGGPAGACLGQPESGAPEGEGCAANSECESGVCLLFQDVPVDDDAVCSAVIEDCSTRITGTVYDFSTLAPIPDQDVNIVKALDALTNPGGAEPVAGGTSSAEGTFDFQSDGPISSPIAIIATVGGGDFFLTATGVASDNGGYEVGTGIHEFWAVPQTSIDTWNMGLDGVEGGPLGTGGGIVGFVRDADGNPVAGATVTPMMDGSGATIRYPQADGSLSDAMTDETGLYVALGGASTGEDYVADANGMTGSGTAGTAPNVVFALVLTVQ
ncbi:MAG: carboxypeptidase-like regulatory domain-containing protein [Myxococcota bacterium]